MTPVEQEKIAASKTVAWAHDVLALGYREIGAVVEADERTVRRWEGREVLPRARHRVRLGAFRELEHLLKAVFDSKEEANEWLHSPLPAFRGRSPMAVIRSGQLGKVVEVLATIESGAYL